MADARAAEDRFYAAQAQEKAAAARAAAGRANVARLMEGIKWQAEQEQEYNQYQAAMQANTSHGFSVKHALMSVGVVGLGLVDVLQFGLDPATDLGEAGLVTADVEMGTAEASAAETRPSVFRTARLDKGQSELDHGLKPSDFGTGNRSAYVGDESAARSNQSGVAA